MLDPLVVGTDEDTHQVTAIISHLIRTGREQGMRSGCMGLRRLLINLRDI
jgi:hypothetical protein